MLINNSTEIKKMNNENKGRIQIYCCGGAGVNIGIKLEKFRGKSEPGFATFDITYIDTSKSNLAKTVSASDCYLIESDVRDIDGGGKIRAENHVEIAKSVRDILQKHTVGNINVVLSSAGGGSGGVIGTYLTDELIRNDIPTIVIVIGSTDTAIEVQNTLKTIKSYEKSALTNEAPINMYYEQNSATNTVEMVDRNIVSFIICLGVLASRENTGLDTRDLRNWLRHDTVTSFEPQLYSLVKVEGNTLPSSLGELISVASVTAKGIDTQLSLDGKVPMLEYRCSGIMPETVDKEVASKCPIHFVTCTGVILPVHKELTSLVDQIEKARAARKTRSVMLSNEDKSSSSNVIL